MIKFSVLVNFLLRGIQELKRLLFDAIEANLFVFKLLLSRYPHPDPFFIARNRVNSPMSDIHFYLFFIFLQFSGFLSHLQLGASVTLMYNFHMYNSPGGGGLLPENLGGGVRPDSGNFFPISDYDFPDSIFDLSQNFTCEDIKFVLICEDIMFSQSEKSL